MAGKNVYVKPTAPKKTSKPATTKKGSGSSTTSKKSSSTSKKSSSTSKKSSSGGGGGGGIKKSSDKEQLSALKKLVGGGFQKVRDQKLSDVIQEYKNNDAVVLKGYKDKVGSLRKVRSDNDKAEADQSFANLANRGREIGDQLAQAALQGAGETDTLRGQFMAVRNWDANQADVNRSYFDTTRSINSSLQDLNSDVRQQRVNLATGMLGDKAQVYDDYYKSRADAYTQMGNIYANPYSDSYSKTGGSFSSTASQQKYDKKLTAYKAATKKPVKGKPAPKKPAKPKTNLSAYDKVAEAASAQWNNPGVDKKILNWSGTEKAVEGRLNNTQPGMRDLENPVKRPEGSTLKKWS